MNLVMTDDNRLNVFESTKHFYYLSFNALPHWIGGVSISTFNTTRDGGKSYNVERRQRLLCSYWFFGENYVEYSRKAYNITNLLSEFGALANVII